MEPARPGGPPPVPWYQRAVPTTLLGVLVLLLATLLVPGLRDELALTVTRRTVPHVELYLSGPSAKAAQDGCRRRGDTVAVEFTVRNHLGGAEVVPFRVVLRPSAGPARVRTGAVDLDGAQDAVVRARFRGAPNEAYAVHILLPGRDERLRLQCGEGLA